MQCKVAIRVATKISHTITSGLVSAIGSHDIREYADSSVIFTRSDPAGPPELMPLDLYKEKSVVY